MPIYISPLHPCAELLCSALFCSLRSAASFSCVHLFVSCAAMDRYRAASTFHGSLPQRPTTLQPTPPLLTSLPPKSHLKEPPFARPPAGGNRRTEDAEISIFDAERYFNEVHDAAKSPRCDLPALQRQSSAHGYARHGLAGSFCSTPTASSEASWNSQSGLLSNPQGPAGAVRALPLKELGRSSSLNSRRIFTRRCPCSCRKSVAVEDKFSGTKSPSRPNIDFSASLTAKKSSFRSGEAGLSSIPERAMAEEIENDFVVEEMIKVKITPGNGPQNSGFLNSSTRFSLDRPFPAEISRRVVNPGILKGDSGGFSFPILNQPSFNLVEETAPALAPSKQPDLQRRAVVFPVSSDDDRRRFSFPGIPTHPLDDDAASDASSDLFELESLCTQTTYRRHDSLDSRDHLRREAATPSIAPSEGYAPSEASVEWSVTTAEGFDRASLANFSSSASYCGELHFASARAQDERLAEAGRRKSVGFLGCRSEKAVSVGPNPIRMEFEPVRRPVDRPVRAR